MTDKELLEATETQIKMVDKVIIGLIREFQNYVEPENKGELFKVSPDLTDVVTAVGIKELLIKIRSSLTRFPRSALSGWPPIEVTPVNLRSEVSE